MAAGPARNDAGTATRILDVAEGLVQVRGFNGFSYADVSAQVGISKAALHYHFAGKADLGLAVIARYASRFTEELDRIDQAGLSPAGRLAEYASLYLQVLQQSKMCLCGMLAAGYQTLPEPMQDAVATFFEANESWLEKVLEEGRQAGTLRFSGTTRDAAQMIIACLEGAMLVARPHGDTATFSAVATSLLAGLSQG